MRWELRTDGQGERALFIRWSEDGTLDTVGKPGKPDGGYGRILIEKALPYSLSAKTSFELGGGKLRCTIELPLERRS